MLLLSLRRWLWQKNIYIYIFFNSLLQSLRRDPEKQIMIFYLLLLHWLRRCSDAKYIYCFAVNTTLHCAMIMTKNKLFILPTLLSLHSYHEGKILFSYCYYVHYTMITTKNKLFFLPTLLSLHNCHENKATTQLSWEKTTVSSQEVQCF